MVDRISSGDGTTPDFSIKKEYDRVIGQIELMEPSTVYAAVQGVVVPTLNSLHNNRPLLNATLPPPPIYASSKASPSSTSGAGRAYQILKELGEKFDNIQKRLTDLYANRQEIVDRWQDSSEAKPIRPNNQALKDFYYSRQNIEGDLDKIKNGITEFANRMPPSRDKEDLIRQLRKVHSDLVSKIQEPKYFGKNSGTWGIPLRVLVETKGETATGRFHWKEYASEEVKVMKWSDSGNSNLPKNPLGIFDVVIDADRSRYNDFLATLSEGRKSINKFYRTDGAGPLHPFALRDLDVQSAYMYLMTIYLPFLQNESAQELEKQGETMKQISKVYDKWSEIQNEINNLVKNAKDLEEKGLVSAGKFNITVIEDFVNPSENKPYKIAIINTSDKSFDKLVDGKNEIIKKVKEVKKLLDEVEKKLPPSSKTLIDTMHQLSDKLLLKEEGYTFYRNKNWNDMRFEILSSRINLKDNKDHEKMATIMQEHMKDSFGFLIDSDQTKFKSYMDNVAQGITALTSISNVTQQELQIATQYYNSLLGLQKSSFDSLNKTMQTILNNIR